ncbi:MAG: phosphoglycerate dehydrogenase [Clostridiales bacterium]|nr:phosphoglycerate dehydrogenase [Clostridiales bacterium]
MADTVLITPRSFGQGDRTPLNLLENAGLTLVRNDTGGILTKEQMIGRIKDCDGVVLGVDPMDADVIAAAPRLRAIARYGVGLDNVDLAAARARGIAVSRTMGANADAVADFTMALMLALARRVLPIDRGCRAGDWRKQIALDVCGGTLGILGLGAIGRGVARRARGFSMRVLAYDPYWDAAYAQANGVEYAEPERIFREGDFVSLHLPLTPETQNIVGRPQIDSMKPTAILINTARGGLVDEDALLDALKAGKLYGAGIDAFAKEPPDNPDWYALDNVVIGSHCAASTRGATANMGRMAAENLLRDLG